MNFVKAHCGGNDFIILDCRHKLKPYLPDNLKEFIQEITERRKGIGADGVIVIENSTTADFGVRYFNPDGSEYDVCGNGSLCILGYLMRYGGATVTFSTGAGVIKGTLITDKAKVTVPSPKEIRLFIPIDLNVVDKSCVAYHFVDMGVPHAVVVVSDMESVDINKLAPSIRYHPYFGKYGTNVNFMQILNKNEIVTRSYERSIEGETLSCGSGSCACAIIGWITGTLSSPIELKTKGSNFRIYIDGLDEIWLEGKPEFICEGRYK